MAAVGEENARISAVAVLGPTASGKSALGLSLAESLQGEIICCDSAQVYRGLDIGSAKPSAAEQARVPHHLLDVADPDQDFHAGAWCRLARAALAEIAGRRRLPVIVGGTGLYFRALTRGLFEAPPPSQQIRARHRAEAEAQGVAALHARLRAVDPEAAAGINENDLVRISRALEVFEQTGTPISVLWKRAAPANPPRVFTIIFDRPLEALRPLIEDRVDAMMRAGFLEEVRALHEAGYADCRALSALGYRELGAHLRGELTLPDAVAETKKNTVAYARRQRTFFRPEPAAVRAQTSLDAAALADQIHAWQRQGVA